MGGVPSVNAANVQLTRRAHDQLVGADVVARALATLPRDDVDAYTTATTLGWVPVRIVDDVTRAVAVASGWPAERLSREAAASSVEALMLGLWRVMLRFTSDEALIARTPLLYAKTYNVGQLESTFPRPGLAEVTQSGWPGITDLQVIGLASGIETVLRCAGREHPKVVPKRTPSGAFFTATWHR